MFKRRWLYYGAIVMDFLLRFLWMYQLVPIDFLPHVRAVWMDTRCAVRITASAPQPVFKPPVVTGTHAWGPSNTPWPRNSRL
jgi:hypothetical protein